MTKARTRLTGQGINVATSNRIARDDESFCLRAIGAFAWFSTSNGKSRLEAALLVRGIATNHTIVAALNQLVCREGGPRKRYGLM
jgi:hypothetical protein